MESRKSRSQSNLLSRAPSTTDLLPHTQSLHSKYSLYNAAGAGVTPPGLPAISSRPGSSRPHSRPVSARPASQLGHSRPGSRMMADSSRPSSRMIGRLSSATPGQRPGSAIRPLSGRVFMRRMEHGWVAKHYPENGPTSQTDLNREAELEDLSDCESLDSFFDEEFDAREYSEKLSNLLSCNTLGVESKGQKPDWNAGAVGIPKFHCPRCRDHWYGVTPFPCDDELARLIREGLWYTGKGEAGKIARGRKSEVQSGIPGGDGRSGSPMMELGNDSEQNKNHHILKGKRGMREPWEMEKRNGGKKSKKRITFKLDDQNEDGSGLLNDKGDGDLNSRQTSGSSELTGSEISGSGQIGLGKNGIASNTSTSDRANESLYNHLPSSTRSVANTEKMKDDGGLEAENSGFLVGSGSNSSLTRGQRRRGRGGKGGKSSTNLLKTPSRGDGEGTGRGKREKESAGSGIDDVGMGLANALANQENQMNKTLDHTQAKDTSINYDSTNMSGQKDSSSNGDKFEQESLRHDSQTSDQKSAAAGPDYGKKVRKAGGYMRASSPTGSEWGDPSHARPYASSTTASSHTGSTHNLLKDKSATLPPIIRKPMVDFTDCGFEITPPWRYSYFSPSPLHSAAAIPTTTASSKSRRRK